MTIKERLEIVRGMPIPEVCPPEEIPCSEISDAKNLCSHPVVSVLMVTYKHEQVIARAIESVLAQKTDFEYELLIGDDASPDETFAVCKKYQELNPDKIRLFWAKENVFALEGNPRRIAIRARGEFVAYCDGDDFWLDDCKLQKQVDAMRKNPTASLCFTGYANYDPQKDSLTDWTGIREYGVGLIPSRQFMLWRIFGKTLGKEWKGGSNITPGILLRREALIKAMQSLEIFQWHLKLDDEVKWLAVASQGDVIVLPDVTAAYRNGVGMCSQSNNGVWRDGYLTRFYFAEKLFGISVADLPQRMQDMYLILISKALAEGQLSVSQVEYARQAQSLPLAASMFASIRHRLVWCVLRLGWMRPDSMTALVRYLKFTPKFETRRIKKLYREVNG